MRGLNIKCQDSLGGFTCHVCKKEKLYAKQIEVGHAFLVICLKCLGEFVIECQTWEQELKVFIDEDKKQEKEKKKPKVQKVS